MKTDIILAGVGGQGILSIATILGEAALSHNLYLKQAEVHGMSQRGGDVMSCLRISSEPIASDLIPSGRVDMIISLEPMEALRYVHLLSADGHVVTSNEPFENIPNYPSMEALQADFVNLPHVTVLPAEAIAKTVASARASNMVLLGAASRFLPFEPESLRNAIRTIFAAKGEQIVESNIAAFNAGLENA